MKKLDALRALLLKAVPALREHPENLSIYIGKGRVGAIRSDTASFEYRYTVTLVVQDYAGDIDLVFVPLVAWIGEHQHELLRRPDGEPFSFEMDVLDAESVDVTIDVELSERVTVKRGDAGWEVKHLDDTPMRNLFPGIDPGAVKLLSALAHDMIAGDAVVVPDTDG